MQTIAQRIGDAADELQSAHEQQQQAIHDIAVALDEYLQFQAKALKDLQERMI